MKRLFASVFLVLILLSVLLSASAEDVFAKEYRVSDCESFITLRFEPSTKSAEIVKIPLGASVIAFEEAENGFLYVNYNGETGYALKKYLTQIPSPAGALISLPENQMREISLFLSNFTESDLCHMSGGVFDIQNVSEAQLVEFAVNHTWFNYQGTRIEWGEYKNGNNVRMLDDRIRNIVMKYFGVTVHNLDPLYVDYEAPYYYWTETGGHLPGGFALAESISYLGDSRYLVMFTSFGSGDIWDNDDLSLTPSQARNKFIYSGEFRGKAVIYAENILDRSTYKLTHLVLE